MREMVTLVIQYQLDFPLEKVTSGTLYINENNQFPNSSIYISTVRKSYGILA